MAAITAIAALAFGWSPAAADTFKPTRFDDPTPGRCKPNDCSLREAVKAADKDPGRSSIRLGEGTYKLEIPRGSPEEETGDLDLYRPATIRGEGPGETQVSGESIDRVFDLNPSSGTELPEHTFRGLTIKRGAAAFDDGGGIRAFISKTKLVNVILKKNSAPGGGGGIGAFRAEITILRSTISGNSALLGGGVFLPNGAALPNRATIQASTVSGNTAEVGGGLSLDGAFYQPTFDQKPIGLVINSTFAGNQAKVSRGGISAIQDADLNVLSSTLAYNGADVDNSGGGDGGGAHQSTSAFFQIVDSLIAGNTVGSSGTGPQCAGSSFNGGFNVATALTAECPNAANVADALIGPLADNGGPTKTVKLLSGSPAVGVASGCPARDQRGVERPAEDCDVGAFERRGP